MARPDILFPIRIAVQPVNHAGPQLTANRRISGQIPQFLGAIPHIAGQSRLTLELGVGRIEATHQSFPAQTRFIVNAEPTGRSPWA